MKEDDRFGITEALILEVIRAHRGIIRAGCYVPTRHEVATREPEWLYSVLIDWWWESPTELIPSDEQVAQVVAILRAREDAEHPLIQKLLSDLP